MLNPSDLVAYLVAQQLVPSADIIGGTLVVTDATQRHTNFRVARDSGPSYLVKQGIGPGNAATLATEAAVYRLFQADPRSGFHHWLAHCYFYDPATHVLVLELFKDAQNWREYHLRRGRFPVALARALGSALGTLHAAYPAAKFTASGYPGLSSNPPAVLSAHRPRHEALGDISDTNLQLIGILQRFPEFGVCLDALRHEWQPETLIHGDMKWSNCLRCPPVPGDPAFGIRIIDWELARIGDPCWDIGSVFAAYLSFWLLSIPIAEEEALERVLGAAPYPLVAMQPAIRAFWSAYCRRMGLDAAAAPRWLLRAVRFAAARLVQTAFEQMQMAVRVTGNIVCLLQLSLNMLQRPEEAARYLLGIPPFERRPA